MNIMEMLKATAGRKFVCPRCGKEMIITFPPQHVERGCEHCPEELKKFLESMNE